MRLMNKTFVLSIFTLLAISCANNKPSDYSILKQKALEIPPDFQLQPPIEGDEEIVNLPETEETEDILTILEDLTPSEKNSDELVSDELVNEDMNLEEFVDENFSTEKESDQKDEVIETDDESALANEAKKAREKLAEIIAENNKVEINAQEKETIVEESSESISENATVEISEDFNEEDFLEELADTEEITSLSEEEQLQPMILDDMPVDDTDFGDEDLNDLLNRVDDLLNSYSN